MPAFAAHELVNPSADPIHYPGSPLQEDALIVGGWRYPMNAAQGATLSEYVVQADGGPLGDGHGLPLSGALSRLTSPIVEARYPVVAVGSNAAPGQLAGKFGDAWSSTVLPVTAAFVSGMFVGYSAHVNKAGYLPYTPFADRWQYGCRVAVLWLTEDQLARIIETEPNYHPATLGTDVAPATLSASRETLQRITLFRSRWGVYRPTPTDGRPMEAGTQIELFAQLAHHDWYRHLLPGTQLNDTAAVQRTFADDAQLRDNFRQTLQLHGLVTIDGLGEQIYEPLTYGHGARERAWGVPGACG